jgi:HlyD family secretion protein
MKKIKYALVFTVLIGIVTWTFWFLYKKSLPKPEVFELQTASIGDVALKTVSPGEVVPRKEIFVKSQVSGVLEALYVEAGKYVAKGTAIAKIKIIPNLVTLNNAESNLNKAQIQYEQATRERNRYKALYEDKLIPEVEYNKYELEYKQSKENYEAAINNVQLIKEGASKSSGKSSNIVYATASGMVLDVPVKEGAFIIEGNTFNEGTTIASIANMNDMIFLGKVDESEVGKIKEGMPITLKIAALTGQKFEATLESISPKGVEEDGAIKFEIKAALSLSKDQFIRSGYSANADIILQKKEKVLMINEGLVQFGKDSVYVVKQIKQNQFVKQLIKTGISDGANIEVIEGLKAGDQIKVMVKKK